MREKSTLHTNVNHVVWSLFPPSSDTYTSAHLSSLSLKNWLIGRIRSIHFYTHSYISRYTLTALHYPHYESLCSTSLDNVRTKVLVGWGCIHFYTLNERTRDDTSGEASRYFISRRGKFIIYNNWREHCSLLRLTLKSSNTVFVEKRRKISRSRPNRHLSRIPFYRIDRIGLILCIQPSNN